MFSKSNSLHYEYDVDGENFTSAGTASETVKNILKQIGIPSAVIRRVGIAMYEGEINMVIHAGGGKAVVDLTPDDIRIRLIDNGPGIPDLDKAMQEGYSIAPDSIRMLGFGAGMGLPNMKKYSDRLKVDTVVGEGTTVTIEIAFKEN